MRSSFLLHTCRAPALALVVGASSLWWAACSTELEPDQEVVAADVASGGSDQEVTLGPGTVRVTDAAGAVVGARIAIRDQRGRRRRVAVSGSDGLVSGVAANELVAASAPGRYPGARRGPGTLSLVNGPVREQLVPRRSADGAVVAEVVAGPAIEVPTTGGLAPARMGDAVPPSRFLDVAGHRFAPHIEALASRNLVAGDPDGRFRPDARLTRAEFAALLLRALEMPAAAPTRAFSDVNDDAWYVGVVGGATRAGLMRGDPDGGFRPTDEVTRAEVAATLRVLVGLGPDDLTAARAVVSPPDVAGHWAKDALTLTQAWCGLFDVDVDGAVRADAPTTRAEAAAAISRALSCEADRAPTRGVAMARAAADKTWSTQLTHLQLLRDRGIGTHFGDVSTYHRLAPSAQQAFLDEHLRGGADRVTPAMLTRSSCVEYVMEQTAGGFDAVAAGDAWRDVDGTTRAEGLKGTSLARELVARGWRAFLVVATTDPTLVGDDTEHAYSLAVARRDHISYGVPLEGALVGWLDDARKKRAMDALPFGVLVQRGGYHVVAVADGTVHELARSQGPHEQVTYAAPWRDIVEVYAEHVYDGGVDGVSKALRMWGSGILVVPPGTSMGAVEWF